MPSCRKHGSIMGCWIGPRPSEVACRPGFQEMRRGYVPLRWLRGFVLLQGRDESNWRLWRRPLRIGDPRARCSPGFHPESPALKSGPRTFLLQGSSMHRTPGSRSRARAWCTLRTRCQAIDDQRGQCLKNTCGVPGAAITKRFRARRIQILSDGGKKISHVSASRHCSRTLSAG